MSENTTLSFLSCRPRQYKDGLVQDFSEVVSLEEPYTFTYRCKVAGQRESFCGEKTLYAYPTELEKLALGHVVLDILPENYEVLSYELQEVDGKPQVVLEVREVSLQCEQTVAPPCAPEITAPFMTCAEVVSSMDKMLSAPGLWDGTGCFHRAALYDPKAQTFIFAEDIGRHNCIDRLKGHALMHKLSLQEYFFFTTARITASLYAKLRRAGVQHMVSRAAITSTSYVRATQEGCTLAAFCRPKEGRVTLFCGQNIGE